MLTKTIGRVQIHQLLSTIVNNIHNIAKVELPLLLIYVLKDILVLFVKVAIYMDNGMKVINTIKQEIFIVTFVQKMQI